jgi:hypothetical protein
LEVHKKSPRLAWQILKSLDKSHHISILNLSNHKIPIKSRTSKKLPFYLNLFLALTQIPFNWNPFISAKK